MFRPAALSLVAAALLAPSLAPAQPPRTADDVIAAQLTLHDFKPSAPVLTVVPDNSIDVIFNDHQGGQHELWRWDVTNGNTNPITWGVKHQGGQGHGNQVALRANNKVSLYDLRRDNTTDIEETTGPAVLHGRWLAWEKSGVVTVQDMHTGSRRSHQAHLAYPLSTWGGWLTYRYKDSSSGRWRIALLALKNLRDHGHLDPGLGVPLVGFGKLVYASNEEVHWEYIGHPATRRKVQIETPWNCASHSLPKIGGSEGQLIAVYSKECDHSQNFITVLNLHSGRSYSITASDSNDSFDFQSNVVAYLNENDELTVVTLNEDRLK